MSARPELAEIECAAADDLVALRNLARDAYDGSCQSNANRSPADTPLPFLAKLQAMRFCHSARAAERRAL